MRIASRALSHWLVCALATGPVHGRETLHGANSNTQTAKPKVREPKVRTSETETRNESSEKTLASGVRRPHSPAFP